MRSAEAVQRGPAGPFAGARGRALDLVLLAVLAGWLASVHAAHPALVDPDEPRSAIIARLMVERGDWLAPHLPAVFHHNYPRYPMEGDLFAYWDKPPLFFWLAGLAMKALGPTALAARLPSLLAHVATALLAYAAGSWLRGRAAGLLAGAVMAVAPLALVIAHVARMEAILAALMAAMLLAVLRLLGDRPRSWGWALVLYGAAGLGLLAKGPVAVALPAAAVAFTLTVCGRWRDLGRLRPVSGAAIMLLVAAPWYIYMHMRYPPAADGGGGFLWEFFVAQHVLRATTEEYGHRHVPGYLLGMLLLGFAPWTVLLPGLCLRLLRVRRRASQKWSTLLVALRAPRADRTALVLLAAWAAVVVLAFSLSKTQLPHYVTPALAPLAVLVGLYLADRIAAGERDRLFRVGLWVTVLLGIGTLAALVGGLMYNGMWRPPYWGFAAVIAGTLAAGVVTVVRRERARAIVLLVAGMVFFMTFIFSADPFDIYASYSTELEARRLKRILEPGDRVVAFPYTPYSLAWRLWPREVPYPVAQGTPHEEPSLLGLIAMLNEPRRTYCVLQKKAMLEVLQREVRWPIQVLMRRPRHILIMTEPPAAEGKADGS
jgi:4-amino-4-deoxy-L-arabinose transferase-like glycosyltransferase